MLQWGACGFINYSLLISSVITHFIRGDTEEKRFEWALRAALTLIIVDLLVAFCALFPSVSICFHLFQSVSCSATSVFDVYCLDSKVYLR